MRIITVSDIVAIDKSASILPNIYECKNYRGSTLEWPRCEAINQLWKPIWKHALETMITPILTRKPLGKHINKSHQTWPARLSDNGQYLHFDSNTYKKCTKTRNPQYRIYSNQHELYLQMADVQVLPSGNVQVLGKGYKPTEEYAIKPNTIMDYFNHAPQ